MGEPCYRVTPNVAIALRDVRPVNVTSQPEKNTKGALVCARGQYHFLTLAERAFPP